MEDAILAILVLEDKIIYLTGQIVLIKRTFIDDGSKSKIVKGYQDQINSLKKAQAYLQTVEQTKTTE